MIAMNDLKDMVQTTMVDMYQPRTFVTKDGRLLLAIGHENKGFLTLDEVAATICSCKGFVELIRSKVEKHDPLPDKG